MTDEIRALIQQATFLFRGQAETEGGVTPMTCYYAASIVVARWYREEKVDEASLHLLVVRLIGLKVELQKPSMEVPLQLPYVGQLVAEMIASVMLRNRQNYLIELKRSR